MTVLHRLYAVSLVFILCLTFLLQPAFCDAEPVIVGFIANGFALDDDSFNGMTIAGLRRLQNKYDLKIKARSGGSSYENFEKQMQLLLDGGVRILVVNSSTNHAKILKFFSRHPEVRFIMNDACITGYDNVSSISYDQCSGSFLVGALCAWQSKTGKVGFIGGNQSPVIQDFLSGFRQGVVFAANGVDLAVDFIRCGSSVEGFEDPRQANLLAKRMYASGVDIIYAAAGLSGNGIIQAARKSGNWVVGVDSDQDYMAKGTILTSMMKRLDVAVYNEVLSAIEGRFVPGVKKYDLSNGGVGLTEMKYTRHLISDEVLSRLEDLKKKISVGAIRLNCSAQ